MRIVFAVVGAREAVGLYLQEQQSYGQWLQQPPQVLVVVKYTAILVENGREAAMVNTIAAASARNPISSGWRAAKTNANIDPIPPPIH